MKKDTKLYQQERAILEITELIAETMKKVNMSVPQLAELLNEPQYYVKQLLAGSIALTVRKISDIFTALGQVIEFKCNPLVPPYREPIYLKGGPWTEKQLRRADYVILKRLFSLHFYIEGCKYEFVRSKNTWQSPLTGKKHTIFIFNGSTYPVYSPKFQSKSRRYHEHKPAGTINGT